MFCFGTSPECRGYAIANSTNVPTCYCDVCFSGNSLAELVLQSVILISHGWKHHTRSDNVFLVRKHESSTHKTRQLQTHQLHILYQEVYIFVSQVSWYIIFRRKSIIITRNANVISNDHGTSEKVYLNCNITANISIDYNMQQHFTRLDD